MRKILKLTALAGAVVALTLVGAVPAVGAQPGVAVDGVGNSQAVEVDVAADGTVDVTAAGAPTVGQVDRNGDLLVCRLDPAQIALARTASAAVRDLKIDNFFPLIEGKQYPQNPPAAGDCPPSPTGFVLSY